jgi:hypothetical protein
MDDKTGLQNFLIEQATNLTIALVAPFSCANPSMLKRQYGYCKKTNLSLSKDRKDSKDGMVENI